MDITAYIRDIPDFPQKGIVFKDITPLLRDPAAFDHLIRELVVRCDSKPIDLIAGIESRGFIIGSALSTVLKKGFVPIRKKGKLPWKTLKETYEKEYGPDVLEIHADAITTGQRVLVVDDLLATGGTAQAAARLIERCGGIPSFCFIIELSFLNGREKLNSYDAFSIIKY